MPSEALRIGYLCKREILPIWESPLDFTIEQAQLLKAGKLKPEEILLPLRDVETGKPAAAAL